MGTVKPTWLPIEAHRLLDGGHYDRLRSHFNSSDRAITYFSSRQRQRYSLAAASGPCCGCGGDADEHAIEAVWDYRLPSVRATLAEVFGAFGHVHQDRHRT